MTLGCPAASTVRGSSTLWKPNRQTAGLEPRLPFEPGGIPWHPPEVGIRDRQRIDVGVALQQVTGPCDRVQGETTRDRRREESDPARPENSSAPPRTPGQGQGRKEFDERAVAKTRAEPPAPPGSIDDPGTEKAREGAEEENSDGRWAQRARDAHDHEKKKNGMDDEQSTPGAEQHVPQAREPGGKGLLLAVALDAELAFHKPEQQTLGRGGQEQAQCHRIKPIEGYPSEDDERGKPWGQSEV